MLASVLSSELGRSFRKGVGYMTAFLLASMAWFVFSGAFLRRIGRFIATRSPASKSVVGLNGYTFCTALAGRPRMARQLLMSFTTTLMANRFRCRLFTADMFAIGGTAICSHRAK